MIRDLIAILRRRGFTPLLLSLVFPLLASSVLGLWKAFELGIAGFMVLAVAVFVESLCAPVTDERSQLVPQALVRTQAEYTNEILPRDKRDEHLSF